MPKKLTTLTAEQKEAIPMWIEKWIKVGLSTEPADRPRFEKAIKACYRFANLKDDIPIIWVSSPIVGVFSAPITTNIIKILKKEDGPDVNAVSSAVDSAIYSVVDSAVHSAVGSAVGSAVYSAVGSAVDSAVRLAVDSAVYSAVHSAVGSAVYSAVYSAVHSAVGSAVGSAVHSAVGSKKIFWHSWLGGSMWCYWVAYTQFFFKICNLDLGEINFKADAYAELSLAGCYSWPNRDFIIACERPNKLLKDSNGKLHCEDSMAITWPDGWGLFMWHGIRVPAKLIMDPNNITKEEILNEKNSEISRAYAERLGWKRYFELTETKKIDSWLDKNTGLYYELFDFENRKGELQPRLLRMESPKLNDGSMPVYIESVDPGLLTAQAARRWQFQKEDGTWPSVNECNKNPELIFGWEA